MPFAPPSIRRREVPFRAALGPRPGLGLGVTAIFLYWLSLYLFVPVLAPQAHRLGAGVGGVGLVLGAYGFVQFLLRVPTGVWSDRLGRRRPFLLAALVACAVAAVGMALAPNPLVLGIFRGVSGLGACGWVAITLLFAEFFPPEATARAFGLVGFLSSGSQLVGMFLGGMLAQLGGYRLSFFGAAVAALVGLGAAVAVREPPQRAAGEPPAPLRLRLAVVRRPSVQVASGLAVASQFVLFVTSYGFVPFLGATRFAAGGAALGVLTVCAGLPQALTSLGSGVLAARLPARTIALVGFLVAAGGTAALPWVPTLPALDAAAAVVGAGLGLIGPTLMTTAVRDCEPALRGSAMGFYQSIYAIGMFGGPALSGWVGTHLGMGGLFSTTAALAMVAGGLSFRLLGARRPLRAAH